MATVNINVIKNHLPVANNMTIYNIYEKPTKETFNATDIDGDTLTPTIINKPDYADITLGKGLEFTYSLYNFFPTHTKDLFSYQVRDSKGGLSNIAWVKVKFI